MFIKLEQYGNRFIHLCVEKIAWIEDTTCNGQRAIYLDGYAGATGSHDMEPTFQTNSIWVLANYANNQTLIRAGIYIA